MEQYNVNSHLDWSKEHKNDKNMHTFAGDEGVNALLRDLKISFNFETKTHQFNNGPCEVAKKLTIEIDLDKIDFPIQPHTTFCEGACTDLIDWAAQEINGLIENIEPDEIDE